MYYMLMSSKLWLSLLRETKFLTCGNYIHKLKNLHNDKLFLIFNITFFIRIFKLYMKIELSRIYEITLFFDGMTKVILTL